MGTRPISVLAGVFAIALIAVGCGGGGDDSSTSSITKEQFIKQADAVCQRGNKRMELAFASFLEKHKDVKRPTDPEFQELVGTVLVPNLKQEVKEIRALEAPSGDEDKIDAILEAVEEGRETAEDDPKVAVDSSDAVFGISSRLATEYGLEVCGNR